MKNSRYKELLYQGKTYTKKYQIDEILIENGFNWFLDAEIENARIEIMKETIIFNAGVWYNGVWEYGVIRDIDWRAGTFKNGVIYNGVFKRITVEKGIIFNGTFLMGDVLFADIRGGEFKDVNISTNVNQTTKSEQTQTQTQSQVQGEPTVQTQGEIEGQEGQEIQSQIEEKYNPRIMMYGNFVNELFLGKPSDNDKLAIALLNKFLEEFKTRREPKMVGEPRLSYSFTLSNEDRIIFDPMQYDPYTIQYNRDKFKINKKTYEKCKEIVKNILKLRRDIIQKNDIDELYTMIGKDVKKYVESKFQHFYDLQKQDGGKYFTVFSGVLGDSVECVFGSSVYSVFNNDISSINIHSNSVIFEFSYPKFPTRYKRYILSIDWGSSFIHKWKSKLATIEKGKDKKIER